MGFRVDITSDPRKLAAGRYEGQVDEDGLHLRKHRKSIDLRVGADVVHDGGNRITAHLPEGRLHMRVSKFGKFQNRFARDVAAFLGEGGAVPSLSDYDIPLHFRILILAPALIPILTLGGALPAALGFGLVMGNFAIAQREDMSTGLRAALMATIAAVAIAAALVLVLGAR